MELLLWLTFACAEGISNFAGYIQVCNGDMSTCNFRTYSLPVNQWASMCDNLGGVPLVNGSTDVQWLWAWIDGTTQDATQVQTMLYEDPYCSGKPVQWSQPWEGVFTGTRNPRSREDAYDLLKVYRVRSMRMTAAGSETSSNDNIGITTVLWPQTNMDFSLSFVDQFTCEGSEAYDVGLQASSNPDFSTTWPSSCASPIRREHCIPRTADEMGAADDLSGFTFADDATVANAFNGVYPMGSALVHYYYTSWGEHSACRTSAEGMYTAPEEGTCVVSKFYTLPCSTVASSIDAWNEFEPDLFINSMGVCLNADGTNCASINSSTSIKPIRCVWTRVVSSFECIGPIPPFQPTPAPTTPAPTTPAPTTPAPTTPAPAPAPTAPAPTYPPRPFLPCCFGGDRCSTVTECESGVCADNQTICTHECHGVWCPGSLV